MALGHDVSAPATLDELKELLKNRPPDVALAGVLDERLAGWAEELVDASEHHQPIYIIVTIHNWKLEQIKRAWDSGADDLMRSDACPEELASRFGAVERIRAKYATGAKPPALEIDQLYVWKELGDIVGQEIGDMLGQDFSMEVVEECPPLEGGAEIMLFLADSPWKVKLGVGIEGTDKATFCELLFGEVVIQDIVADALREMTNVAGGAFKREALVDDCTFALSLPKDSQHPDVSVNRRWAFTSAEGMRFIFWCEMKAERPDLINAHQLREGMVLSRDIRDHSGALLVTAGRVLTKLTCERLIELVGSTTVLEVNVSAAA